MKAKDVGGKEEGNVRVYHVIVCVFCRRNRRKPVKKISFFSRISHKFRKCADGTY